MKKLILLYSLALLAVTPVVMADHDDEDSNGVLLGLNVGSVGFGLGGSSRGPVIGVGPYGHRSDCRKCSDRHHRRHHRHHCASCDAGE